jgi:SAM-dependent methyltransferase
VAEASVSRGTAAGGRSGAVSRDGEVDAPARCPLCEGARVAAGRRHPSPYVAFAYTLFECADCASAFFDTAECEVNLGEVYDEYAAGSVERYSREVKVSRYWKTQVEVLCRLRGAPVRSVLDVGCRTGDFLMHWPADVERVGIELSRRAADVAERRGLRVLRGFVEDVDVDRAFDVIGCYAVVEHLREPVPFLRHLAGRLNPGGVLAVLVPTRQCLKHSLVALAGRRWHQYTPPEHLSFPSRAQLDRILASAGLALALRRYTSGGMFNPLRRVPRANAWFDRLMLWVDHASALHRWPVFDHMYSFYVKRR